ncbi:MAG: cell wall hydrolase [Verrucomicrobiota bacterium]
MSTRRNATAALLGLPVLAGAIKPEPEPGPFSEATARIVSYTLYAEARGEPFKGKLAVASVIKTRAIRTNTSLAETCLKDRQFSCWNELTAVPEFYISGKGILPADIKARTDCYGLAWLVTTSQAKWDYLTHFYNPSKVTPPWAGSLRGKRTIGNHVFGYID